MTADPVRIGLIGVGPWGRNLLRTLDATAGAELVAVASRTARRADLPAGAWTLERDWTTLLTGHALDAIVVAVPPAVHGGIVARAIAAGLHVLVEKPLALDPTEAFGLAEAAARAGTLLLVDHVHLFNPAYLAMRERLAERGGVRAVRTEAGNLGPFRPGVPVLWDWGPHDVALCMDLLGSPVRVESCRRVRSGPTPRGHGEVLELALRHPGEVPGRIRVGNLVIPKTRRMTVWTDREVLVFDDLAPDRLVLHPAGEPFVPLQGPGAALPAVGPAPLEGVIREFTRRIRFGECGPETAHFGAAVVAVLAAAERVLEAGPRAAQPSGVAGNSRDGEQ